MSIVVAVGLIVSAVITNGIEAEARDCAMVQLGIVMSDVVMGLLQDGPIGAIVGALVATIVCMAVRGWRSGLTQIAA